MNKIKNILNIILNIIFIGMIVFLIYFLMNYKIFIITSGSMEPEIPTHSLVIVKPEKEYNIGDIISYYDESISVPVTHRIISYDEETKTFDTQGDANNTNDNIQLEQKDILGKVVLTSKKFGNLYVKYNKIAFIGIISIMCIIIVIEVFKFFKNNNTTKNL